MAGARPRTLPAAVVPVLVGTACAVRDEGVWYDGVVWWRVLAAMVVSLALQVGTNYANDYSDGVKGTDSAGRVGPVRLVASGLKAPASVKRAAFASFAVAGIAGLALAAATTWWLVAVGAASMLAGWFYTGGPRPYGYAGFGELFVFVFFGVVATVGSAFVHREELTGLALAASVPVGFLATALLVVNNLRDIPTDSVTGKITLAVRLGDRRTRSLYTVLMVGAVVVAAVTAAVSGRLFAIAVVLVAPLVAVPIRVVRSGAKGRDLIPALGATGRAQLVFGLVFALGLALA
jgi:1,4-dihydroxy-2-naphthoate octaprenyltransferase